MKSNGVILPTNSTPSRLKDALLEALVRWVEEGEPVYFEGEPTGKFKPASASVLNAAINFLKEFPPADDMPEIGPVTGEIRRYTQLMPETD